MICHDLEMELWLRYRERSARDAIVERHRYLCVRGARKYARRRDDRADMEQVGAVGLIKAVDRYRSDSETPFEAYAWILVQGELQHYVRDHERFVRAPRRLRELDRRWRDVSERLTSRFSREPEEHEIAAELLVQRSTVAELREYRARSLTASLDVLSGNELSYTMEDHDDRLVLESALAKLSDIEREVLRGAFEEDVSAGDLALRLGYSVRHVNRIRRNALVKLAPRCVRNRA